MNAMAGNTLTIELSLSEISALSRRAARGAGFEWGEADEAAFAAEWMARAGMAWLPALLAVLTEKESGAPAVGAGAWSGPSPLCALRTGIALSDFALLPEGPATRPLVLREVGNWPFLLPFVWRACHAAGKPLAVRVASLDQALTLSPRGLPAGLPEVAVAAPADLEVSLRKEPDDILVTQPRSRATADLALYESLARLALQMTVPSSAVSQAGAGATGSDND